MTLQTGIVFVSDGIGDYDAFIDEVGARVLHARRAFSKQFCVFTAASVKWLPQMLYEHTFEGGLGMKQ